MRKIYLTISIIVLLVIFISCAATVKKPEVTPAPTPKEMPKKEVPIVTKEEPCPYPMIIFDKTFQFSDRNYAGSSGKAIVLDSITQVRQLPYPDCPVIEVLYLDDVIDVLNAHYQGWYTIAVRNQLGETLCYGFTETNKLKIINATERFVKSVLDTPIKITRNTFFREKPSEESESLMELTVDMVIEEIVGWEFYKIEDFKAVNWLLIKVNGYIAWILSSETNFNEVIDEYFRNKRR